MTCGMRTGLAENGISSGKKEGYVIDVENLQQMAKFFVRNVWKKLKNTRELIEINENIFLAKKKELCKVGRH